MTSEALAPSTEAAAQPEDRRSVALWAFAVILALSAAQRLADGFYRLLLGATPPVDLRYRWTEVQRWFGGDAVYRENFAVYPPASYVLLWPLLGWLDLWPARWLWALTAAVGLAWLARTCARESGSRDRAVLLVVALVPLAAYASRGVIVNGQIALHLLPLAVAGLLLLDRRPPSWRRDLGGAALLLAALAKPTLTAPFVWVAMTARGPLRPLALIVAGYAALTVLGATAQPAGVLATVQQFAKGAIGDAMRAAPETHANLHSWLAAVSLRPAFAPASLAVLGALGVFVWAARRADVWVRIGVAALVARMWTVHLRYDDVLVVLALVPLARMVAAGRRLGEADRPAAILLALAAATLLMPARLLFPPWPSGVVEALQTLIWVATLGFLGYRALAPRTGHVGPRLA